MEENFEGLTKGGWHKEDFKTLTSQLKERESLLRLKRRWLMGLPLSKREQERVEELLPPNDKILPESLVREDDLNYDDIRSCIERGYNAHNCKMENHGVLEGLQIFNSHEDLKDVLFLLDDMTNKGLYTFVEILTGGLVKYEKTNCGMKKIIREFLPKVLADKSDISKTKLEHIFRLLKDGTIFRGYQAVCATPSEAYRAAGMKILEGLEDFPFRALNAMHRKLREVRGYIPTLQPPKSGWNRDGLINVIRKKCLKMLLDLSNGNEPAESLAGALGVAGLTLKLILNQPAAVDFRKFSPEIEALQNDLARAIFFVNDAKRVSLIELRRAHSLLSPNVEMSVRSLRMAVRNLLTEYLFECSDMDKVPNCLLETLDIIINNRYRRQLLRKLPSSRIHTKEEIQKEVEHVLIISAQAKEVVWNILPEYAFDQDFFHAYMEDFEQSDILSMSDDNEQVMENPQYPGHYSHDSYRGSESICETSPVSTAKSNCFSPLLSPSSKLDVPLISFHATEMDSDKNHSFVHSAKYEDSKILDCSCTDRKDHVSGCFGECGLAFPDPLKVTIKKKLFSLSNSPDPSHNEIRDGKTTKFSLSTPKLEFSDAPVEQKIPFPQQSRSVNRYLEVQDACDAVSMVAYKFVGQMLDELAKMEGLELQQCDRLYLRSGASVHEDAEGLGVE
ncbi:uncharacterized protein [Henckelia pumila]|uniref:uncharacterized protein isoform X2 n=1 Tax=Henckelia pumila TaxID=405737 RepID=UPI003C6E75DD